MVNGELIDLRTLPVWERPALVFDVFDRLPIGGSVTVLTENEPRGLAASIERARRHQVIVDPQRVSEREWIVQIVRSASDAEPPTIAAALRRAPVFHGVSSESMARLTEEATLQTVRRGHTIVAEKHEWPYLGLLTEGVLAFASGHAHSRARIFGQYFPFDVFGELELFDGGPAAGRIFALSKQVRYVRIPRETVLEACASNPTIFRALGRVSAQRSRDLMQALATQGTMPIIARIAQALLPFAVTDRGLAPVLPPLPNMTQAQIAAAAGTVKEVAARAIAELEQRHMLKRERGHITLLDRQKLSELVKGGE